MTQTDQVADSNLNSIIEFFKAFGTEPIGYPHGAHDFLYLGSAASTMGSLRSLTGDAFMAVAAYSECRTGFLIMCSGSKLYSPKYSIAMP